MNRWFFVVDQSCGTSPDVQNSAKVVHGQGIGDSLVYTCQQGYEMFGNATIHCMSDENWSEPPSCEGLLSSIIKDQYWCVEYHSVSRNITIMALLSEFFKHAYTKIITIKIESVSDIFNLYAQHYTNDGYGRTKSSLCFLYVFC